MAVIKKRDSASPVSGRRRRLSGLMEKPIQPGILLFHDNDGETRVDVGEIVDRIQEVMNIKNSEYRDSVVEKMTACFLSIEDLELRKFVADIYLGLLDLREQEGEVSEIVEKLRPRLGTSHYFWHATILREAKEIFADRKEKEGNMEKNRERIFRIHWREVERYGFPNLIACMPEFCSNGTDNSHDIRHELLSAFSMPEEEQKALLRLYLHCFDPNYFEAELQELLDESSAMHEVHHSRETRGMLLRDLARRVVTAKPFETHSMDLERILDNIDDPEIAGIARLTLRISFNREDDFSGIDLEAVCGEKDPSPTRITGIAMSFLRDYLSFSRTDRIGLGAAIGEVASLWYELRTAGVTKNYQENGLHLFKFLQSGTFDPGSPYVRQLYYLLLSRSVKIAGPRDIVRFIVDVSNSRTEIIEIGPKN